MKKLRITILTLIAISLCICCTPENNPSDQIAKKPEIFSTGGDQSIYPDNERD